MPPELLKIDLVRLDEDEMMREQLVGILRLLHSDFPAGLRHNTGDTYERPVWERDGDRTCLLCELEQCGIFCSVSEARGHRTPVGHSTVLRIHPDFATFIHGNEDQDYINAIRAWVAMQGIMNEAPDVPEQPDIA